MPDALLHFLVGVGRLALSGGLNQEFLVQGIQLGFVIALETVKVGFVVFLDDLFDEQFLNLGGNGSIAFPYQHNEVLQEVGLLHVQLLTLDAEGIHGDRMLLGIADILATDILAQSLIRVTGIDHNDIGILLPKLAHHTVHMRGLLLLKINHIIK